MSCVVCVFVRKLLLLASVRATLLYLYLGRRGGKRQANYLPGFDLLCLDIMAGATQLWVPVKQMLTTENVSGQVSAGQGE